MAVSTLGLTGFNHSGMAKSTHRETRIVNTKISHKIYNSDLSSRRSASQFRAKIMEEIGLGCTITIDLADVISISDSYADELFGVLCLEIGMEKVLSSIRLNNADDFVLRVIAENMRNRISGRQIAATSPVKNCNSAE